MMKRLLILLGLFFCSFYSFGLTTPEWVCNSYLVYASPANWMSSAKIVWVINGIAGEYQRTDRHIGANCTVRVRWNGNESDPE